MTTMSIRWDWVVIVAGFALAALLVTAPYPVLNGLAIPMGYALGRWDSEYGVKYR